MTLWDVVEPVLTLVTSVSSLVVASIVGIAVIEGQKNQSLHNRLSVKPSVRIDRHCTPSKGIYQIFIRNAGFGPALIKSISFRTYLDPELKDWNGGNVAYYLEDLISIKDKIKVTHTTCNNGTALAANGEIPILDVLIADDVKDLYAHIAVQKIRDGIAFNICFESIYGEQFQQEDKIAHIQ